MKRPIVIGVILGLVVLGVVGAYYFGTQKSAERIADLEALAGANNYQPPADIRSLLGTAKGVYGSTIDFETADVNDYLPHADGSPARTVIRFVTVTPSTEIVKLDTAHDYARTSATLSDITAGATLTVYADTNIHDAQKFDASRIELIQ